MVDICNEGLVVSKGKGRNFKDLVISIKRLDTNSKTSSSSNTRKVYNSKVITKI